MLINPSAYVKFAEQHVHATCVPHTLFWQAESEYVEHVNMLQIMGQQPSLVTSQVTPWALHTAAPATKALLCGSQNHHNTFRTCQI